MDSAPAYHLLSPQGDSEHASSFAKREERYNVQRAIVQDMGWCREHYIRMPTPKTSKQSWSNLWGLLNTSTAQALEIFITRVMCVYDQVSDWVVIRSIDRTLDPIWFVIALSFSVGPFLLKCILLYKPLSHVFIKQDRTHIRHHKKEGTEEMCEWLIAVLAMMFVDLYLLVFYPWLSPSDAEFLSIVERLSPLIETYIEGILQSCFQVYMCMRISFGHLPGHETYTNSLNNVIFFSFVPSVVNILYVQDIPVEGRGWWHGYDSLPILVRIVWWALRNIHTLLDTSLKERGHQLYKYGQSFSLPARADICSYRKGQPQAVDFRVWADKQC